MKYKKQAIKDFYLERAKQNLEKYDNIQKATRETASETYQEFPDLNPSNIRKHTREFRIDENPYHLDAEKIENVESVEKLMSEPSDDGISEVEKSEDFSYDRVNFDRGDVGELSNYLVTDHEEYVDYDEEKDVYETIIPEYGTIRLPGEIHRAVKTDYSEWVGDGDTISKITRKYPFFDEFIFKKYKKLHGWTHESSPFTKEELQERAIDDMQADLSKLREHELWRNDKEKSLKKYKKGWEELQQMKKGEINPVIEELKDDIDSYSVDTISTGEADSDYALVVQLRDIHLGAQGDEAITGEDWTIKKAKQRVFDLVGEIINKVKNKGQPEKIFVCGSDDFCHIDTIKNSGTTTFGTDMQTSDFPERIAVESFKLMREIIDSFRQIGSPIELIQIRGNHDRLIGRLIAEYVDAWYRKQDDVTVNSTYKTRSYKKWGKSLLGFSHGFEENKGDLHKLMANEAGDLWQKRQTKLFFTGHRHSYKVQDGDASGVILVRASSPAGTDSYHHKKGFVGATKAINGYAVDRRGGLPDVINGSVRYE